MSYVKENLMQDEKILFTARINPAVFLPSILMFFLSCLLLVQTLLSTPKSNGPSPYTLSILSSFYLCTWGIILLYAVLLALQAAIIMFTTEFAVTNRRIIAKTGFIRRHTLEMFLHKVESVRVNQNVLQRLLNFGSVTVTGTGGTRESFKAIVDPVGVRGAINQVIEKYTQRTSVR